MDQLINALPAVVQAADGAEEVIEAAAFAAWNHVAGKGLRWQTVATRLRKQTLIVAVIDSVWQRQLESLSGQFLFRLNSLLGKGAVKFIEFRVEPQTVEAGREQNPAQAVRATPANSQTISLELVAAAAAIHDPDLRRSFLGAASSCVRRREAAEQNQIPTEP